jgi:hypothetical protein
MGERSEIRHVAYGAGLMGRGNVPFLSFSGGEVSKEVLQRVDLEKYPTMAERMENFMPQLQGGTQFRPGLQMLHDATSGASNVWMLPFIYSNSQKYLLYLSGGSMYVMKDGGVIQRLAVSCSITNGGFVGSLTGWTSICVGTGYAVHGSTGDYLSIGNTNGVDLAGVRQAVTTASPGVQHAISINVGRGPVKLLVGTSTGAGDLLEVDDLRTGRHSLAFIPPGTTFHVQFSTTTRADRNVLSVAIEAAGDLSVPAPWSESEYANIRYCQSTDVVFVATGARIIKRVERRGDASWSIVDYNMKDGPWLDINTDLASYITPSAVNGDVTLTASKPIFKPGHVGSLYQLQHSGQNTSTTANGGDQFTNEIKVQGTGEARTFYITISGTWVGHINLLSSTGNDTSWIDTNFIFIANTTAYRVNDGSANQIIYYKLGFKSGDYTSGSADLRLDYSGGTTLGVARIIGYTSPTVVVAEAVTPFGQAAQTNNWNEGAWSDVQGWPKAITLYDGRLFSGRSDNLTGSVSDAYESANAGLATASDAINRKVATGSVNSVQWMLGLLRLLVGTEGSEVSIRATMYDDPLTPTNFSVKDASTVGAANVAPVKYDSEGFFVSRDGEKIYMLAYNSQKMDYAGANMMKFNRHIGKGGIVSLAMARQPDPRLYAVRADGQCLVMLFDSDENVLAWSRIVTDGAIEQVCVLPGTPEDEVIFVVRRTIGGATWRYIERMGPFTIDNATAAAQMDSYAVRTGSPTNTVTGATWLEGRTVCVWADGTARTPAVVTGGAVTFDGPAASTVCIGLPYTGYYKSGRLSYFAQGGTALNQLKRPTHVSLLLRDAVGALFYGQDFVTMDQVQDRQLTEHYDAAQVLRDIETEPLPMLGGRSRDARLCLKVASPYPMTVGGVVLGLGVNERI